MLTDDNQNFWEGRCAIRMALSVWILKNTTNTVHAQEFTFVQSKFSATAKCDLRVSEICE